MRAVERPRNSRREKNSRSFFYHRRSRCYHRCCNDAVTTQTGSGSGCRSYTPRSNQSCLSNACNKFAFPINFYVQIVFSVVRYTDGRYTEKQRFKTLMACSIFLENKIRRRKGGGKKKGRHT